MSPVTPLPLLKSNVEHALSMSAQIPGDSVATKRNMIAATAVSEATPFPILGPVPSRTSSSSARTQQQTPTYPIRTYTHSSAASSAVSSASGSSFFFGSVPSSATSLASFGSTFSYPLLPPVAPSPLFPLSADDAKAVLSLDGGGVRGIFAPLFFRELQKHMPTGTDFRTLLDLVGGTSTGGVAALMLARLDLPLHKILDTYLDMPKRLFSGRRFKRIWWLLTNSQHSTERQEKLYGSTVREALGNNKVLLKVGEESDGKAQCPCFVVTLDTDDVSKPTIFSSYSTLSDEQRSQSSDNDAKEDVTIVTAALATSAAPTYFHPTVHNGHMYIDGGVGFNNPSEIALKQLTELYGPSAHVHTFISLGTGRREKNPYRAMRKQRTKASSSGARLGISGLLDVMRACAHISTDSQAVHERMSERFAQTGAYYRFNPPGLENIALDDWTAVDAAVEKCEAYLALPETQARIEEVAIRLLKARGMDAAES